MPVKKEEAAWVDGKMMGKGWKRALIEKRLELDLILVYSGMILDGLGMFWL